MNAQELRESGKRVALLSVTEKRGLVEFAKRLVAMAWAIISSGGTAKVLRAAGIEVIDVEEYTGLAPTLGDRVKTLTPQIHGGLLAKNTPEHDADLLKLGAARIDLLCVNLYALEEEIAKDGSTHDSVIENTDVGGIAMLWAACKGERIIVSDPDDYDRVCKWLEDGMLSRETFINDLANKARYTIVNYVMASMRYHSDGKYEGFVGERAQKLRYGENPQQKDAVLYSLHGNTDPLALHRFTEVAPEHTMEPSYVGMTDVDRLIQYLTTIVAAFSRNYKYTPKIAAGVKHGNTCGAAQSDDEGTALRSMLAGNLTSIFGGVIMVNFLIDEELAEIVLTYEMEDDKKRMIDGIMAPAFTPGALELLKRKHGKCRHLVNVDLDGLTDCDLDQTARIRHVRGGFIKHDAPKFILDPAKCLILPNTDMLTEDGEDATFAWAIGSRSNSNTVVLVNDGYLIACAVGQQSRVAACELAVKTARDAGHKTKGALAYSDSFFPFPDGPMVLAIAGIRALVTSSGSQNDELTRKVSEIGGMRLYMVPDKEGRGFAQH